MSYNTHCLGCGNLFTVTYTDSPHCPPCRVCKAICDVLKTEPAPRVLDVGAGLATYLPTVNKIVRDRGGTLTLLDAHAPYLASRNIPADVVQITGTAQVVLPMLNEEQFDVVLAIDFIEHLEKEEALLTIRQMKWRQSAGNEGRLLIFTPLGEHPQDKDHYGMGGDHWQTHRSTWYPEDLEKLGFKVEVWKGFHAALQPKFPDAIWATW